MLELEFTLGPLHWRIRLANPATADNGSDYVDLAGDYDLAPDDDQPAEEDRTGFRRNR